MDSQRSPEVPSIVKLMVDGGMDAAAVVDRNLGILHANSAYISLVGLSPRRFAASKQPGMCHTVFGLESCKNGCAAITVMEGGRPLRLDEVWAEKKSLRLQIVAIPLINDAGETWGAIEQYRDVTAESKMQEQYRRMLEQEREQSARLAQELTRTHERSREALEQERRFSQTDGLTGVYNRRFLEACLRESIGQAMSGGTPVAMILFDLDHFKNVNDTYGHAKGDETLREFGKVLREAAREEDIVARFGGEEFTILVRGTSIQAAALVAKRVLTRVRERVAEGTLVTTTSGGMAICPGDANNQDNLVQMADRALYAAKRSGRNRILAYPDLNPEDSP